MRDRRFRHDHRPHRVASAHLSLLRLAAAVGLLSPASHALGTLLPRREVELELDNGRRLTVPLHDPYWMKSLLAGPYEPGVGATLEAALAARPDTAFLDCGANIGYWSVAMCDRAPTVAVEPVPPTFRRLAANARRNGFHAIEAAVWDDANSRVPVRWSPRHHYAASVERRGGGRVTEVRTVTLDQLAAEHAPEGPLIAKLDVEGAEATALRGAAECAERCLFVYEDHGGDREHLATRAFLEAGFQIWHVDGAPRPIGALAALDEIKRNEIDGYNFAAHRGALWSSLLPAGAG